MNYLRFFALALLLINSFFTHATDIIHTNDIAHVLQYVTQPTDLVVFDLDETLITLDHGEHWIGEICTQKKVANFTVIEDFYVWYAMQDDYRLLEPHTADMIAHLQQQGNIVIALTARSTERLIHYSSKQLLKLGIDFSRSGICTKDFVVDGVAHPALYYQGIISSGKNNKGALLIDLLERFNIHPTKIIFVDDKLKNVEAVRDHAHVKNIPFVGIRYGRTDGTVVTLTQADHLNYHAWVDGMPCFMGAAS